MRIPEYETLEKKKDTFGDNYYRRITTIEKIDKLLELSNRKNVVFRGLCEAKYKNFTSAQRLYMVNDIDPQFTNIVDLIQEQIESVKSKHDKLLDNYYKSLNISPNDFMYMGIAQHYGGISPLLDITTDLKTALFFMTDKAFFPTNGIDDIGNYFSLYFVNTKKIMNFKDFLNKVSNKVGEKIEEMVGNNKLHPETKEKIISYLTSFNNFKKTVNKPLFIPNERTNYNINIKGEDKRLGGVFSISNLNIVAQNGCFVFYLPNEEKGLKPFEAPLYCIDIHKSLTPYIKDKTELNSSNIYPDEYKLVKDSYNEALRNILDKSIS